MKTDEKRIVPATFDPMFKALLTNEGAKEYLAEVIEIATSIPKDIIMERSIIANSEHMIDHASEKGKTSDIIIYIENKIINLEMNKDVFKIDRNISYAASLFKSSIHKGDDDYKYVIQINFNNFLEEGKFIKEYFLMEKEEHNILSDKIEIITISLEKLAQRYYNKDVLSDKEKTLLLLAIEKPDDLEELSKGRKSMEKAKEIIENASNDMIGVYDVKDYEHELNVLMKLHARDEGKMEGIAEGASAKQLEIAKNMLVKNYPIEDITSITGLSKEEIEKL